MAFRAHVAMILILCFFIPLPIVVAADKSDESGDRSNPKIFLPETRFEFSPVLEGTKIVHDFAVQNKGSAVLKIERVKTG